MMVYFRLVTTTLSTCWSVFKDAPLSAWVQSDVLQVPDKRCVTRCVTRCFTICAFKRFLLLLSLVAAILFTSRKQSVKIFYKLLIVVNYFLKILPQPKKYLTRSRLVSLVTYFTSVYNLWLWSEVKETSLLTAACKYHVVEACDQKQEKKHPSYYNNSDCILQKTAFSLVKSRLALGSPGC